MPTIITHCYKLFHLWEILSIFLQHVIIAWFELRIYKRQSARVYCRGIRGATTVEHNSSEEILAATKELLQKMIDANGIQPEAVASAIFTTTPDLNTEFPAAAAREMGWADVALLCSHEMDIPGSLPMCLRILVLLNTEKSADKIEQQNRLLFGKA